MKNSAFALLLCCLLSTPVFSQTPSPDDLGPLGDNVISLKFNTQIFKADSSVPIWNQEVEQTTILGKAVSLRLERKRLLIVSNFTPYKTQDQKLILLAQVQVWLFSDSGDTLRYYTTMKTLDVVGSDKIVFFPLGYKPNADPGLLGMQIDILVAQKNPNVQNIVKSQGKK